VRVDRLIEPDVNVVNGNVFPFDGRYVLVGNDSYQRRHAYLQFLDGDFRATGERTFLSRGFEDHRIVTDGPSCHLWCNYGDGVQMFCGQLDPSARTLEIRPAQATNFTLQKREKNWCPLVIDGTVLVVYSLFPELTVLRKSPGYMHEPIFSERSAFLQDWLTTNVDIPEMQHLGGGSNYVAYRDCYLGTFHVKYRHLAYSSYMIFLGRDFAVKGIVPIDYGERLFESTRLAQLKAELERDEGELFYEPTYRRRLKEVAFTTGLFLKDDSFHISLGINDLVTKVAVIAREKVDQIIDGLPPPPPPLAPWETPVIESQPAAR